MGAAISIVVQPPVAHFGWAQRKITELQFPKSAVAGAVPRVFIIWFHALLFMAPILPLNAVKLLPAVVDTAAIAGVHGTSVMANNKNLVMDFIFSRPCDFTIKMPAWKAKSCTKNTRPWTGILFVRFPVTHDRRMFNAIGQNFMPADHFIHGNINGYLGLVGTDFFLEIQFDTL